MSFSARLLALCALTLPALLAQPVPVRVWEEDTVIPTYVAGPPDENPFFYTGRTYQGARGEVYPYPMYDNLTDRKEDRTYKLVCLENEYVKVCVLPELGGRIFEAKDKTNGYDFFYKQSVIKPALIGMLGAWISGGVEWNIPHHHRASSFLPIRYKTEERADGSRTIWVGEMELRDRMRWAIGLTLRPGSSVLEAKVTALNTTPLPHSLLYFANVAVHTNDNYQVVFPPATHFATQHAKREFARWPIADSVYNGVDFTKGVDVSYWKNHPSAISMFAWNESDEFLAGYDHGRKAGTLHVADHHQVPGKKFFAWGTGPSGRMWDNILSDTDGPYLELMVGAWSDNQPDYSWLQPYETKTVEQYWYPFREIGAVKQATTDAAVNLEVRDGKIRVGFNTTSLRRQARAVVTAAGKEIWSQAIDIDPSKPFTQVLDMPSGTKETDLRAALLFGGRELVAYQILAPERPPMPPAVVPPPPPSKVKTAEELYLAGLRLEQFHNPSLDPDPYYEEALRRDPGDSRANTALGLLYLKRGRYADAEKLLRPAVERISHNYTRPKDGEALYYLGLALRAQDKKQAAADAFQRAAWTHAWKSASYLQLAELASLDGALEKSVEFLERSLETNSRNTRALSLESIILSRTGRGGEGRELRRRIETIDPMDPRGYRDAIDLVSLFKQSPEEGLELVQSCLSAGLWREAEFLLDRMPVQSPMIAYMRGWVAEQAGQTDTAKAHYARGSAMPITRVFPFQIEAERYLRAAMNLNPQNSRPPYYLGLLLFDRQRPEAMRLFAKAAELDPKLALAHRNLAVGYSLDNKVPEAIASLERAIELNPRDALYLFEIDRLYEWNQEPVEKRLALFTRLSESAQKRDDTTARHVGLLVQSGKLDDAIARLEKRHFHLWEGGVRFNAHDSWTDAHMLRGRQRMAKKDFNGALSDFRRAIEYPANLEATRSYRGSRAPEVFYFVGLAEQALGRAAQAQEAWREAASELIGSEDNPHPTVGSGAVLLYYQGLSLQKLGRDAQAKRVFDALVKAGNDALKPAEGSDFFAKFGDRQSPQMRQAEAHYVRGLGHLGLGDKSAALADFERAMKLNRYLTGAREAMAELR